MEKLIYLDWDTVAYIAAPAAWRVMDAADPPVHFAAGTGYPPFGTANNVFTMFTNASLYDYLLYVATHLLLKLPPECGPSAMPAGREAVGMINSYTDMKQLFTYGLYAHRESIPPYVGSSDGDWLRDMPTLASTSGKCDDSNVNCNARRRWHTPPGSSPYGAHFPVWAFHPPKYRIFNLYEPFGRGNLVSDLPIEISNKGANLTGFKGELSGVASALPHGPAVVPRVGRHLFDALLQGEVAAQLPPRGQRRRATRKGREAAKGGGLPQPQPLRGTAFRASSASRRSRVARLTILIALISMSYGGYKDSNFCFSYNSNFVFLLSCRTSDSSFLRRIASGIRRLPDRHVRQLPTPPLLHPPSIVRAHAGVHVVD